MDHVALMQVVNSIKHLADRLRRILFGKLALLADAIEQLAACGQLGDDVPFILASTSASTRQTWADRATLDSNHSWNLTMCG
jgi:hypothetical protein